MDELTVSIVVASENDRLVPCLDSICNASVPGLKIYVVDNQGNSGQVTAAVEKYPDIIVIRNKTPLGFASNHNQVLKAARSEFYLLLNDDTLVHPGALHELTSFLRSAPNAGCVSPRLLNEDGSPQTACFRLPSLGLLLMDALMLGRMFPRNVFLAGYGAWAHDRNRKVPFVSGAAIAFSRAALDRVGLWDEDFFMYGEDADYCFRCRRTGLDNWLVAGARVTHFGGQSIGGAASLKGLDLSQKGIALYFKKNVGGRSLPLVWLIQGLGCLTHMAVLAAALPLRPGVKRKLHLYFRKLLWLAAHASWPLFPSRIVSAMEDRRS